jgi:hypothetical protein
MDITLAVCYECRKLYAENLKGEKCEMLACTRMRQPCV